VFQPKIWRKSFTVGIFHEGGQFVVFLYFPDGLWEKVHRPSIEKKKYFYVINAILKNKKVKVEKRLPTTEYYKSKFYCKECTANRYYQFSKEM
jgi:hypothetical protein